MKKLFFLLLLLPLLGNAQDFEYFGVRAAFTHSNKSHNLGFIGASLNSFDEGNGYFFSHSYSFNFLRRRSYRVRF